MKSQKPSFVFGYWRPWNENSNLFESYLDYKKDTSLVKYGADTIGKYISKASNEQIKAINRLGHTFVAGMGLLSEQINQVSNQLNTISNQISEVNQSLSFLNRNIDILIEQQKLSNLLLQNIAELLRVPDSEKERQHSIELGIKFFVNAKKDQDLFNDSLEELLKAESLMKQDYFVLHRIGCIYLYADKLINPERAFDYFSRAAKYSSVESDPKAARLANVLSNISDSDLSKKSNVDKIKEIAADSYEKAAFAAYILGDFAKAVQNQTRALELMECSEYRFLLAKYQIRVGDIKNSLLNLDEAINVNPYLFYGISNLLDLDFVGESDVIDLLESKDNQLKIRIDNLAAQFAAIPCNMSFIVSQLTDVKDMPYHLRIQKIKHFETIGEQAKHFVESVDLFIDSIRQCEIDSVIKLVLRELEELKKKPYSNNVIEQFERIKEKDDVRKVLADNSLIDNLIQDNFKLLEKNRSIIKINEFEKIKNEISLALDLDLESKYKKCIEINDNINTYVEINKIRRTIEDFLFNNFDNDLKRDSYSNQLNISEFSANDQLDKLRNLLKSMQSEKLKNEALKKESSSSHSIPETALTKSKKCFIATAAMGSEDHYVVKDLRKFRDDVLNKYFLGKIFIKFYYFTSPPIACVVEHIEFLRTLTAKYFIKPLHRIITKHMQSTHIKY
jgi:hypothetical protein